MASETRIQQPSHSDVSSSTHRADRQRCGSPGIPAIHATRVEFWPRGHETGGREGHHYGDRPRAD